MLIYLLRHGNAGLAPPGTSDRERALTADGEQQVRAVVARAARAMGSPEIVSSPYLRARQTAAIASELLGSAISESEALTPESHPDDAWAEIRILRGQPALLLVGHEPLFSGLTAYLLGHPALHVAFGTATIVCLEVDVTGPTPYGILRWMLTPLLAR